MGANLSAETFDDKAAKFLQLHAETVAVIRRRVEGDTVRVRTVTKHREQLVEEELHRERVSTKRVPINRQVDVAPSVRQEGDTTIIPVVEEMVVVERRLMLKEEVRITRVRVTNKHQETVILREQEAVITRTAPPQIDPSRNQRGILK